METDLNKIKKLSKKKEKENEKFRLFLKGYNHKKVDEIVHKLNQKYMTEYDCRKCGNCCKKLTITLTDEEIKDISEYLNISCEKMKEKYIERKTDYGYILQSRSCPFLKNNKCSIYEYRPEVCRSFPNLHKKNINHRLLSIIENSSLCPIIYNILEDLKTILNFVE
ncbi:MAG: YkgJ family cysteine cluster protein [Halanaerobiales bacterium]